MTVQELKSAFVFAYNYEPDAVYFTMDRVNLIGEHFNNNNISVFSNTLSFGIYLLLRKNNERCIKLWSLNEPEAIQWKIDQPMVNKNNSWIKYPIGVINQLIRSGVEIDSGYDMLFWGNIPKEAELSPSKELELITDFALKDQLTEYLKHKKTVISFLDWNIIPEVLNNEIPENLALELEGLKIIISNHY